ncbi:membrane protein DedA, SNARE-associated domain [Streptoalloteichus tenebrarius]|uniref:Membrane protein DedA, SNARE-associated domain n=1 Tax=Streptoalloteichus tenebrarius (strain ATCC 17920 / DSM 40477 / JCM 4838 / CBS 697.72 / NBRC 16177 / NCIMB 11028 / NRRL B-12390 / A12253. 1 / ISP 5477) TaxID=1933 RepID=A0ABT1I369_STRSD|nr:DedA family protein [Streptoalloteichus tenebrarius]MCP2262178.1 membrane protein DedA, SNARE-associated domain [Streptoalloteichus tenebrarius]BFF00019.1 DedA family protein [Streptoalloteichus tenebrarius]
MALLTDALEHLAELPKPAVIAAAGALAFGECTLGLGFLVPGEAGLLIASTAVTDRPTFVIMALVVAVCAALGDSVGYYLGHRFGPRMRESRVVRKLGQEHWDRAGDLLRRHGARAVFFARFLPVVRTLTPAAAGASGLAYRRFLPASLLGAIGWSCLHIGIGAAFGASAKAIEKTLGTASWGLVAALVVIVAIVVLVKRRRAARAAAAAAASGESRELEPSGH